MGLILLFSEVIPIFYVSNPCKTEGERRLQFAVHKMLSVIIHDIELMVIVFPAFNVFKDLVNLICCQMVS